MYKENKTFEKAILHSYTNDSLVYADLLYFLFNVQSLLSVLFLFDPIVTLIKSHYMEKAIRWHF